MKAQKIIFILVLTFFLGGLGYFGFQVWEKRYEYFFQGGEVENTKEENEETGTPSPAASISPSPSISASPDSMTEQEKVQDILENHCSQNCRRKVDLAEKKYCLEICGLSQSTEVFEKEDCEKLSGQEKDICWKNLAIKEKQGSYCDKIEDAGIKESCQNRLVEEFLN